MSENPKAVWMDGTLVPWEKASIHVMSHTVHYGSGVFEGIRCYETPKGPAVFRLEEHVDRLLKSAACVLMESPYNRGQIAAAIRETIRANGFTACYVRPLIYRGLGAFGLNPLKSKIHVAVAVWEWGAYLGKEGVENGIRLVTASWLKNSAASLPTKAKVTGSYINSVLAKADAILSGFDEALMLDHRGLVAEGTGENAFFVKDGVLHVIDCTSALEGITRESVIVLAKDLGIEIREGPAAKDQLYNADEVFLTGTAAELTPVREIDRRAIGSGKRGPVTARLQEAYARAVRGQDPKHADWCSPVDARSASQPKKRTPAGR